MRPDVLKVGVVRHDPCVCGDLRPVSVFMKTPTNNLGEKLQCSLRGEGKSETVDTAGVEGAQCELGFGGAIIV